MQAIVEGSVFSRRSTLTLSAFAPILTSSSEQVGVLHSTHGPHFKVAIQIIYDHDLVCLPSCDPELDSLLCIAFEISQDVPR